MFQFLVLYLLNSVCFDSKLEKVNKKQQTRIVHKQKLFFFSRKIAEKNATHLSSVAVLKLLPDRGGIQQPFHRGISTRKFH